MITLANGQTITIPVGQSSASSVPFNVRADDAYTQGTDTLSVGISNTSGGNFEALTTSSTVSTTVTDDADRHGGHPHRLGRLGHRGRQHRLHRHASTTRSPARRW